MKLPLSCTGFIRAPCFDALRKIWKPVNLFANRFPKINDAERKNCSKSRISRSAGRSNGFRAMASGWNRKISCRQRNQSVTFPRTMRQMGKARKASRQREISVPREPAIPCRHWQCALVHFVHPVRGTPAPPRSH